MSRAAILAMAAVVAAATVDSAPASAQAWQMSQTRQQGWRTDGRDVACTDLDGFTHPTNHVMTWYLNPTGGGGGKDAAIKAALKTWTDVANSDYDLRWGGYHWGDFEGTDGRNTMAWGVNSVCDNDSCHAITSLLLGPGQVIVEADILFNANPNRGFQWMTNGEYSITPPCWQTPNSFGLKLDTQGVATHELGHTMGIGHPTNFATTSAVMGARACTTGGRTLRGDDAAALKCSENRYPVNPNYQGAFERAGCRTMTGWAWNTNQSYQQSYVEVMEDFLDGRASILRGVAWANLRRSDVGGLPDPYHGFSLETPAALRDGRWHLVSTRYSGTGAAFGPYSYLMICGLQMFPGSMRPSDPPQPTNGQPYEVGTEFKSDYGGYITEIGYYWAPGEAVNGNKTVKLWNENGDLIGTGTLQPPNVYLSVGWSYASIGRVAIQRNVKYVASVDTYDYQAKSSCGSSNSLASPYVNYPLTALQGLWRTGVGVEDPPSTPSCSNFFVSVVFESG